MAHIIVSAAYFVFLLRLSHALSMFACVRKRQSKGKNTKE